MTLTRPTVALVLFASISIGFTLGACGSDGEDGAPGTAGTNGTPGPQGPTGNTGPAGIPGVGPDGGLSSACTTPCHTFNGIVDQWRFSNHSHPQKNDTGGSSCGNCHALDGIQQRVANNYRTMPDSGAPTDVPKGHINYRAANGSVSEIIYGATTTIGRIHCTTCHDFNATNDPHVTGKYTPGQAPIRVAGGANDTAFIEKSPDAGAVTGEALKYRAGNLCIFCHKSRKDVTFYIGANNTMSSIHWGPHQGPQADVYSGKGGYHFAGQTYSSSVHATVANGCVSCHMQPDVDGGAPDHTMKAKLGFCKTCHTQYNGTTFDVQSGQSTVKRALRELAGLLNTAGLLTRSASAPYQPLDADELTDDQFHLDEARPGSGPGGANQVLDAPTAGALYNYLIIARSKDFGVHNPTYAKQLLWDSIKHLKGGTDPTSLPARPN